MALNSGHKALDSRLEAELLLAFVLKVSRTYLYTWPEQLLTSLQYKSYQDNITKRVQGEPIAYLIGEKEFWSLPLIVTQDVLIPRPETELLVEVLLQHVPCKSGTRILELGTGSGAIALALAKECPRFEIIATDISRLALNVARENAKHLAINSIEWIEGNWFEALSNRNLDYKFDAIISNPPYIAAQDEHLEKGDLRYEPKHALTSGSSGLEALTKIIQEAPLYMEKNAWLIVEHGWDQAEALETLFKETKKYTHIKNYKDLANLERLTMGQLMP